MLTIPTLKFLRTVNLSYVDRYNLYFFFITYTDFINTNQIPFFLQDSLGIEALKLTGLLVNICVKRFGGIIYVD